MGDVDRSHRRRQCGVARQPRPSHAAPDGVSAVAVANRWYRLLMRMYRVARSEDFDMIQVRNSSAAGLAAVAIRRATGIPFAFQVSFPVAEWTTEAARRGDVRAPALRRIAAGVQRALRKRLVRRADLVLAISDRMRDELVRDGAPANRIVVIPLGTEDPPEPDARAVGSLRSELGLGDGSVILYVGSISPQRELGFLVHVAANRGRSGIPPRAGCCSGRPRTARTSAPAARGRSGGVGRSVRRAWGRPPERGSVVPRPVEPHGVADPAGADSTSSARRPRRWNRSQPVAPSWRPRSPTSRRSWVRAGAA